MTDRETRTCSSCSGIGWLRGIGWNRAKIAPRTPTSTATGTPERVAVYQVRHALNAPLYQRKDVA